MRNVFSGGPDGVYLRRGVLSFLFADSDGDVGVAIECGGRWTELLS